MAALTIDPDVRGICASFTPAQSFAQLVQAIVRAEGDIVKAVQCSDATVTTREQAIRVVCRSVIHRMTDWVQQDHPREFTTYMGSFWAPIGATNDPRNLNANWSGNVAKLWTTVLLILGLWCAPAFAQDAFDFSQAQIVAGSPDARSWPITTLIAAVHINSNGVAVDFDAKARWPSVTPPGWDAPLQYTLWLFVKRNGVWTGAGVIEFWPSQGGRPPRESSGPYTQPNIAAHVAENWIHDGHWGFDYAPALGEPVGFMVTAGDQRVKDVHIVAERSNVVLVPLQPGDYPFGAAPPPPVVTPTPPVPVPVPTPPPTLTCPTIPIDQLAQLNAQINACNAAIANVGQNVDAGRKENQQFYSEARNAWQAFFEPVVKYVLPLIGGMVAGWQIAK